jgi:hypothetical protein
MADKEKGKHDYYACPLYDQEQGDTTRQDHNSTETTTQKEVFSF